MIPSLEPSRILTLSSSPRQLVSTYKGKFGYVHYYVKALMERPQQPTLECKKAFDVEEPLDVNTPDLLVSVEPSQQPCVLLHSLHLT